MSYLKNWLHKISSKKTYKDPLPKVTLPFNQELKVKQERWLISLIILIAISGFYTYFYVDSYNQKHEIIQVWAASENITAPQKLGSENLELLSLPQKSIPDGAFVESDKDKLLDQVIINDLVSRQIILSSNFQAALDPKSVSAKFDELFAFSLDEDWFEADFPAIRKNDLVDIIVSNPKADLEATAVIISGARVIDVQRSGSKKTLILNLNGDESKAILFARGLRLPMQILVHSAISKSDNPE